MVMLSLVSFTFLLSLLLLTNSYIYKKIQINSISMKLDNNNRKGNNQIKNKNTNNNIISEPINNKIKEPKNFATKTILGQNIINCRPFSIESQKTFDFLGSYKSYKQVAFLGRSNVGKSSLLNSLTNLNKDIAVASKTPGRTQSINLFRCTEKEKGAKADVCIFVDLPGYGFAKMSKESQAEVAVFIKEYLEQRGALRLAVLLVDSRRDPQQSDAEMIQLLNDIGVPYIVVATKTDKLRKDELSNQLNVIQQSFYLDDIPLAFSAVTGVGRKDVWRAIRDGVVGSSDNNNNSADDDNDSDDDSVIDEDEDL